MKSDLVTTLFWQFAFLSLLAVGGANVLIPDLHRIVVDQRAWLSDRQFTELFALANAAPGPNVLIVCLIGFKVAGVPGGLSAMLGMCLPSSILSFATFKLWHRFRHSPWRRIIQHALAPITIGLVLAGGFVLSLGTDTTVVTAGLTIVSIAVTLFTKINPLWILAAAGILGLVGIV